MMAKLCGGVKGSARKSARGGKLRDGGPAAVSTATLPHAHKKAHHDWCILPFSLHAAARAERHQQHLVLRVVILVEYGFAASGELRSARREGAA